MTVPTIQDLQADVTAVQAALLAPDATTVGAADYVTTIGTLKLALTDTGTGAASAEASMNSLIALGTAGDGVFAFDTAANGIAALNAATGAGGYLAFTATVAAYLGRALKNLAFAST